MMQRFLTVKTELNKVMLQELQKPGIKKFK